MKTILTITMLFALCACSKSPQPMPPQPNDSPTPTVPPSFGTPRPPMSTSPPSFGTPPQPTPTLPPNVPPGRPTPTPKPPPTNTPPPFNGGSLTIVVTQDDAPRVTEAFGHILGLPASANEAEIEAAMSTWLNNSTMDYERRKNIRSFTPPPLGTEGQKKLDKPLP